MIRLVMFAVILIIPLETTKADTPSDPPRKPAGEEFRLGQIFIIGNTATRRQAILRHVPFTEGQTVRRADFPTVERNLARLNLFKTTPTITVLDAVGDSKHHDILISVKERRSPRSTESFAFFCSRFAWGLADAIGLGAFVDALDQYFNERWGTNGLLALSLLTIEKSFNTLGDALRLKYNDEP